MRSLTFAAFVSSFVPIHALAQQPVNSGQPAPDCQALTGYGSNEVLQGYTDAEGICHPFRTTYTTLPEGEDAEWYIEHFTDAAIRERWESCKNDPACGDAALEGAEGFTKDASRDTGAGDPNGLIDPHGEVDLANIRRPAYFGEAPYDEPIADAEASAYTIEFTVPRDNYEKVHLGLNDDIHLRGWYLAGQGVALEDGSTDRALVIMNNGGNSEFSASDLPGPEGISLDPADGSWNNASYKLPQSEEPGQAVFRSFISDLYDAGFDVLVTDRRGNGISGGNHGYDTAEQGYDMFRMLDALESGEGLRVLTPSGETLAAADAAAAIFPDGGAEDLPVVLGGYSRGSYATAWAMHKNFVGDCNTNSAEPDCAPAIGDDRLKGAILYGPNPGGLGYRAPGHDMEEAALRVEYGTTYRPDGEVFDGIAQWPAVSIIRGVWDYVEGLEGSLAAFEKAQEPKEIYVFNGPHSTRTLTPDMASIIGDRMAAFARAAVSGADSVEGAHHPADLKDLVLSAPAIWELTTTPRPAGQ
ncbi:hypothetical protein [Paracoccus jeotgali]|uniref:hypothetical protein n=1 Tax=Paracoccus jeotgali TaxID=2065379 RepID=UPI0028A92847|nr:hypothetical protein [Paracoccus jeotgali]